MTLKNRWRRFVERMNKRERAWSDRHFDVRTYSGNIRALFFWCAATYLMWNIYEILVWWDSLWGAVSYINHGQQSWARIWAVIIGGTGISVPVIAMIMIPINRRRAQEYADDQRRRRDEQTWKPEDDSDPPPETTVKAVWPEQDAPLVEDSIRNDEPQESVGIRPPPNAEPPERFGYVHLEKKDGRATLVVSKR